MTKDLQTLRDLIASYSWPSEKIGKWKRTAGLHIGTKEAIFSPIGVHLVGRLTFDTLTALDPQLAAVAGDGVGGTAIAVATAAVAQAAKYPLTPLHLRTKLDPTRNKLLIEGALSIKQNCRVAIVDDSIDTGHSLSRLERELTRAGYVVSVAMVLVSRRKNAMEGFDHLGIKTATLFDLAEIEPLAGASYACKRPPSL